MKINEIEISKLKELQEKSKMLKDQRQKGKVNWYTEKELWEGLKSHWNVENKLHWHTDFTFKCDDNTTMK